MLIFRILALLLVPVGALADQEVRIDSATDGCTALIENIATCNAYMCTFNEQVSYNARKHIVGRIPGGCLYVEYLRDEMVECFLPDRFTGSKTLNKYFKNQENISITRIDIPNLSSYCKIKDNPAISGLILNGDFSRMAQITDADNSKFTARYDRINSLFFTRSQMIAITEALR